MKTEEKVETVKPLRMHIQEFLDRAEARYTLNEEHSLFSFNMENNGLSLNVYLIYNEESEWMRCHITMPVKVPKDKRSAVIWKMNGFNYDHPGISISMDVSDGEIVVTMLANTDEGAVNGKIINAMILSCYNAFDVCIPEIMRLIYQQPENILMQMANNNSMVSGIN